MMRHFMALMFLGMLALGGCAGDRGKELFETARFEEQQHNRDHAEQIYREILKKYPKSSYAEQAGKRLAEIENSH